VRAVVVLLLYVSVARADGIGAGAAVGAGGQGNATYSAIDLGLDAQWHGMRIGLGGRAVWLDGEWRRGDWEQPRDAVRALRLFELRGEWFGIAGGGLAPAQLLHVADGHRAALDDRARTGVRIGAAGERASIVAEIDDVIDPSLIGGALAWSFAAPWRVHAAAAVDPSVPLSAIEVAVARRWQGERAVAELGGGGVGEPARGAAGVAFADAVIERAGARWYASVEARAGTGTVGAAFGPLHRLERTRHDGARGVGGAIALGASAERLGWVRASVRRRPELGWLASASLGLPMWRRVQASAWIAASEDATAGAGALRVAWSRGYASVIELARMYSTDATMPTSAWSATAWFGITTD
jgi:hypothetical protein